MNTPHYGTSGVSIQKYGGREYQNELANAMALYIYQHPHIQPNRMALHNARIEHRRTRRELTSTAVYSLIVLDQSNQCRLPDSKSIASF